MARRFPINLPDDELRRYLRELDAAVTSAATATYRTATLSADLNAGASVVISGITYVATFVRSGYKLASGTVIGANYDGTTWHVGDWNTCEVVQ